MATDLVYARPLTGRPVLPFLPWRDPHAVAPQELGFHIAALEQACLDQPQSADLRTCLGMAYAVNYDIYKSMAALETATRLDPTHFWAQLKYGELHYRLRAIVVAERETAKAVELAKSGWQLSLARRQLQDIRKVSRESARNVTWDKPLTTPTLVLSALMLVIFVAMAWR